MRKNKIISKKILILLMAFIMMLLVFPMMNDKVYADSQVNPSDMDINLFNRLVRVRGTNNLKTDSFVSEKFKEIDLSGDQLYSDDSTNITDVSGLTKFRFENTEVLDLSHNSIKEISNEVLMAFPKLKKLIVSDNLIEKIDLTGRYTLNVLIADKNRLTELDATDMDATNGEIDLSGNYFTDVKDITLPNQALDVNMTIKLYNNNVMHFDGEEEGYKVLLGLQGFQTTNDKIELKQKMAYYKADNSQKLKVAITENGEEKYVFKDTEIEQEKTDIVLTYGSYEISYYYINDELTELEASTKKHLDPTSESFYKTNDYLRYYEYKKFDVVPSSPSYVYVFKGKKYNEGQIGKITKTGKIELEVDEGCKAYYKISSGDWTEGTSVPIKRGGNYNILVKSISINGNFESQEVCITINASPNLRFPSILIAVLIVIGMVLLFGVVFPLLKKYVL